MNKLVNVTNNRKVRIGASFLLCWVLTFALSIIVPRQSDDANYAKQLAKMNGFRWVVQRYKTWSGRLFSETISALVIPAPLWVWSVCNALFMLLLVYSIIRITFTQINAADVLFVYALYWLISPNLLGGSTFWIAGSVAYLWPTALAVFACIPLSDAVQGRKKRRVTIYVIAAFLGALGVEQVAPCLIGFAGLTLVYLYIKEKRVDTAAIWILIVSLMGALIQLLSPGMRYRSKVEMMARYPEFAHLSFIKKITKGVTWQFGMSASYLFVIFAVLAVVVVLSISSSPHDSLVDLDEGAGILRYRQEAYYVLCALVLGQVFAFIGERRLDLGTPISAFKPYGSVPFSSWVKPYLFWSVFYLILVALLVRFVQRKGTVLVLFLASIAAGAIMYFSPTIYASGSRTLFISGVLLIMIPCVVQNQFKNKLAYLVVFIPSIINFISLTKILMRNAGL